MDAINDNRPRWITEELDSDDIAAILQGGCSSGAYMPAVTYADALETMSLHGDDVLQYIEDTLGEIPTPTENAMYWSGMACFYLSLAVELWAAQWEVDQ